MTDYLKISEKTYEKISQQDHFHEFSQYLSENKYKSFLKKMNYNYMLLMLLLYFDFQALLCNYNDIIDTTQTMILFVKKIILFVGISNSKVYDPIIHSIETKKRKWFYF